jgi:hydroxymethylpyrimidine pyrophosphatase-like HAD family hydrolase
VIQKSEYQESRNERFIPVRIAQSDQYCCVESAEARRGMARETQLVLVTGRELPDLKRVFPAIHMFDRAVAENGALIYDLETEVERALVPAPPAAFLEALRQHGVTPLSVGRAIVATWRSRTGLVPIP